MTGKQAIFPNSRQAAFLTGLADTAIAEQDAAKQILTEAEEKAEAETKRRVRLGNEAVRHRLARLEATGRAEIATKMFVTAVVDVREAAGRERGALTELSGPHADTLADVSIMRRLSRYLSHELRQLSGPTGTKFGEIRLCHYFRADTSWEKAERHVSAALPGHEGNGAHD